MNNQELLCLAEQARAFSYAPYSHFTVGAALLTADGKVYTGCNIENASFSATVCAERTALYRAVAEGNRDFVALAVIGGAQGERGGFCAPCGICRQVLSEFCNADFTVILGSVDAFELYALSSLLPLAFNGQAMKSTQEVNADEDV